MAYIDVEITILALAGLFAFLTIVALGMPLIQQDPLQTRMKTVAKRREELHRQQKEDMDRKQRSALRQQKKHVTWMQQVLEKVQLQNLLSSKKVRIRLSQAGYRSQSAAVTYIFLRFALPVGFAVGFLAFLFLSEGFDLSLAMTILITVGVAFVGYMLPPLLLSNQIQKRQQTLMRAYPDALDLLVICVEAGLSVEAAFSRVAEEVGESSPELAEEFGLTTAELAFLGDRRQAYMNMADRTGMEATKALTTALLQSEKYGTPVAVALRVVAQESRDERMARAERKAGALPAQLTVPMILFFLPVLFIVILGPAVIRSMKVFAGAG